MTHASRRAALLLAALSSCTVASAVDATYQYFRFTPIKLRNDSTANSIQVAEFQFLKSGAPLPWTGAAVSNPGGNRPATEFPSNLIDGATGTKWLDFYRNPVVFAFPAPVTIDGYRFTTANDATERDPVRWILEGSNDESTWAVLDHLQADFATPTGRAAVTPDILLGAATTPYAKTWAGGDPANWDTTTANWDNGAPVAWSNTSTDIARFGAGTPATVSLAAPISVRLIDFTAPVTELGGNTLTFTNVTRVNPGADMAVTSVIAGNVGVIKTGPQTLTLSANNTFTGPLQVRAGAVVVSGTNAYNGQTLVAGGGTLSFTAAATKAAGALEVGNAAGDGTLNLGSSAALVFNGTPVAGNGAITPGAGAIRQSSGTVTFSQDGQYLTLANTAGSYGTYELSGGTASTPSGSGIRVGFAAPGVLTQSGGSLSIGRWFAIGGGNTKGHVTLTGGTTAISNAAYRVLVGDGANSEGVLNIGTAAGGTGILTAIRNATAANDGAVTVGAGNGSTGYLNLNSGVLKVHSRIYRASTTPASTAFFNLNGGTLRAGAANVELVNNSLTAVRMHRGGLTIDTDGNAATFAAPISGLAGNGLAITSLPVTSGGSGYIGAPLVSLATSGTGSGAMAIATVSGGVVTGVTLTCPGDGYAAGDTVFFDFNSGGGDTLAESVEYVLGAGDVVSNNSGGLTKTGAGALTLSAPSTFTGPLAVNAGTLVANGTLAQTAATVAAGATLTGNLNTGGGVTVNGTLAPGTAVGTATGAGTLTLAGGSTFAMQLADWTGAAGTGFDTADFGGVDITASSGSKFMVSVDATGIANFSESAKSFVIVSADAPPAGIAADNWQVSATGFSGTGTWALGVAGNNLVLTYTPPVAGGYASWVAGFPGLADDTPDGDPEGDGISNLLEYVLNGNPSTSSAESLPKAVVSGGNLVLSFVRRAESKGDSTQVIQYGSSLTAWTDLPVPAASAGDIVITVDSPSAGLETVVATIPDAGSEDFFARLKATRP